MRGGILICVCRPHDLILDPFAGSVSSRTASYNLSLELVRRDADIDPAYAELS